MNQRKALQIIYIFSIAGLMFSGYLSYIELFREGCNTCGSSFSLLNLPACVYGFFMYLAIFCISLWGLNKDSKKTTAPKES